MTARVARPFSGRLIAGALLDALPSSRMIQVRTRAAKIEDR